MQPFQWACLTDSIQPLQDVNILGNASKQSPRVLALCLPAFRYIWNADADGGIGMLKSNQKNFPTGTFCFLSNTVLSTEVFFSSILESVATVCLWQNLLALFYCQSFNLLSVLIQKQITYCFILCA
jgi:hypothetical protein